MRREVMRVGIFILEHPVARIAGPSTYSSTVRTDQGNRRVRVDAELFHERSAPVRKARLWHDDVLQGISNRSLQRAANPAPE